MKKALSLILALALCIALAVPALAAENDDYADALYALGLFQGTGTDDEGNPVYALDNDATRAQALVMLIRLMGEEEAALATTEENPFTDVPEWAVPYVAYGYAKGYTNGMSATEFCPDYAANANMYLTFMLRALGYDDAAGDFDYNTAYTAAVKAGLVDEGEYPSGTATVKRDDCVYISYQALDTNLKDSETTLADKLIEQGVFTAEAYETATAALKEATDGSGAASLKIALIPDSDDLEEYSFNKMVYEAAKNWAETNGAEFQYFVPDLDSENGISEAISTAIDEGYNVILTPGFLFAEAVAEAAPTNPEVSFVALDVSGDDFGAAVPDNVYAVSYREELCGYMAGYAAVKLGYGKLGFLGGMSIPAVKRYGYGFVQGVDAAAKDSGRSDVTVNYAYGNQFYGDPTITAAMDEWYADGIEVVFACGGNIFTSVAEAAAKADGKVIGVDLDQAPIIDAAYGEGLTVTSAVKALDVTVVNALDSLADGSFTGGTENLGLISDDPAMNNVRIPLDSTQWNDSFTQEDYKALTGELFSGTLTVSDDISGDPADFATVITLVDLGELNAMENQGKE